MNSKKELTGMMDSPPSSPFSPRGSNGFKGNSDADEVEAARNIINAMIRTTLEIQVQMERGEI